MIKLTNEIALITAVSDLSIFFDSVKGTTFENLSTNSLSAGVKSPSGPINIVFTFSALKLSCFKWFLELTSAKKSLFELLKLFIKSLSLITFDSFGGFNWLDCSVASIRILLALS